MTTTPDTASANRENECCRDFSMSRRSLLGTAAALGGGAAMVQLFGESVMQATFAGTKGGNTLLVLSLRGGIDGLGVVVPHGDPGYYSARPTTAIAKDQVICGDSMFGLHPKMQPLASFWSAGQLAAIQAVGLPAPNRSHFSAIEEVEDAAPGSNLRTGWLNRMLGTESSHHPFDGVQLGQSVPTAALMGSVDTVATTDVTKLQVPGLESTSNRRYASLQKAWSAGGGPLAESAALAVAVSQGDGKTLANMADSTVSYPTSANAAAFVNPLKNAAKLIKADLGTDVITIDAGMWDYHSNYGTLAYGNMQNNLDGFARSLAAFMTDLGPLLNRVTIVTISEFGRRVAENGSKGFDHGWGNMMLLAGAGVKGGRYYGNWPTLTASALAEGDLKVTTDYRNVLGEVLARRFPDRTLSSVFPGFSCSPVGFMA